MNSSDPVYLVILKNGPIYSLDDYVAFQLEALSSVFAGELWVTGSFDAAQRVGNFTANVVKQPDFPSSATWLRNYVPRVLNSMRVLHARGMRVVVVSYDPFKNGMLGRIIKSRFGWPLIVEINGTFANRENYADLSGLFARHLRPLLFRMLARWTLAKADGVRLLFKEQLEGYATPPAGSVIRTFFDAVRLDRFPPGPEERFLLHVGFPFRLKGVDLLLQAFSALQQDFPDWKLVLIGHDLERHVAPVPVNVMILKAMPNREVATWISRCGCYVLASRSEGMGRVLLEAAAAQKARVAARVGGTYTVVDDGKDGLLFEKGNVADLVQKLRQVMGSEDIRNALGLAARERVLRDFTGERYATHVRELVTAVLSRIT